MGRDLARHGLCIEVYTSMVYGTVNQYNAILENNNAILAFL